MCWAAYTAKLSQREETACMTDPVSWSAYRDHRWSRASHARRARRARRDGRVRRGRSRTSHAKLVNTDVARLFSRSTRLAHFWLFRWRRLHKNNSHIPHVARDKKMFSHLLFALPACTRFFFRRDFLGGFPGFFPADSNFCTALKSTSKKCWQYFQKTFQTNSFKYLFHAFKFVFSFFFFSKKKMLVYI